MWADEESILSLNGRAFTYICPRVQPFGDSNLLSGWISYLRIGCRDSLINESHLLLKSINISLPDTMQAYVEQQVAEGGYSSVSEYFRELVRQDQKQKSKERLETMLLEGLNSGDTTEMTVQDWEDIRQTIRGKLTNFKI